MVLHSEKGFCGVFGTCYSCLSGYAIPRSCAEQAKKNATLVCRVKARGSQLFNLAVLFLLCFRVRTGCMMVIVVTR